VAVRTTDGVLVWQVSLSGYVLMKDEKMLKALEIAYEKDKVKVDLKKFYPNIDIAETFLTFPANG
jgi:hypothetical protein